jgi:hypothetical protein
LTRSHHIYRLRFTSKPTRSYEELPQRRDHGVTYVNVYRRSLSSSLNPSKSLSFLGFETRKDSAVHVSLSSSSLVKQPGALGPTSIKGRSRKVPLDDESQPMTIGCQFTHLSEELHRRGNRPDPEGLGGAALSGRFISRPLDRCQHVMSTNRRIGQKNHAAPEKFQFSAVSSCSRTTATILRRSG